ncbi:hypothetical protein EP837_02993 [Sphingobium sp. EP60837]|nr:hypothetical protein EP837_02993 [Sphingobium sp. EP60837]
MALGPVQVQKDAVPNICILNAGDDSLEECHDRSIYDR